MISSVGEHKRETEEEEDHRPRNWIPRKRNPPSPVSRPQTAVTAIPASTPASSSEAIELPKAEELTEGHELEDGPLPPRVKSVRPSLKVLGRATPTSSIIERERPDLSTPSANSTRWVEQEIEELRQRTFTPNTALRMLDGTKWATVKQVSGKV